MNVERCLYEIQGRVCLAEERFDIGQNFTNRVGSGRAWRVGARSVDAVAGTEWRPPSIVVVLIGGEDKERVAWINSVITHSREELIERIVICFELRDVARLAGTKGAKWECVAVMCIRDVGVRDGHAVLLHCRGVSERLRCGDSTKPRKSCDRIAGKIVQAARSNRWHHVFMAIKSVEANVAVRLVR